MLWLDLQAAGVTAEMGEVPFDWFAREGKREKGKGESAAAPVAVRVEALEPRMPVMAPVAVAAPKVVAAVAVAGRVWSEGNSGGVVVVLEGEGVLQGRARELLGRMLASVGIGEAELAWVGFVGAVAREELLASVKGLAPVKVLVLGQNPLAALLGKKLGVEGWQAAPSPVEGIARMGVTYPPSLLLAQPLFKRLAWQHLLSWRMGWE